MTTHEAQIRAYLLDYLLNEVKDKGTPLLEECQCYRGEERTGIADYFISVHGSWVPVEAKLNILGEKDLLAQIGKYVRITAFSPTRGSHRQKRYETKSATTCLVADQSGIYIVTDERYFKCAPGIPVWQRTALSHATVLDIRNRLQDNGL